jgi:hypothetical protein
MSRKVKVALCLPWYSGADKDCTPQMLTLLNYFGRLSERLRWLKHLMPLSQSEWYVQDLPKLDPYTPGAEVTPDLVGTEIEFGIASEIGCSLVGMARERCVDYALAWGADYCFFFDADMLVPTSAFLQLFRDNVPVVGALAFTGRDPITPVIYTASEKFEEDPERPGEGRIAMDFQPVLHYEKDALQQVQAIGSGVMLIKAEVFKQLKKPWFYSTGVGEDIYFCLMCKRADIPVYVDTRVKTAHKARVSDWQTEEKYLGRLEAEGI